MIRIHYIIEGVNYEEVISPAFTPLTPELIREIQDIYIFESQKHISGVTARRYASLYARTKNN